MISDQPAPRHILSVASAPGWGALFQQGDDLIADPRLVTLAAWALVEENDGQRRLVGLVQKSADSTGLFAFADEIEGFAGYSNQGLKTKATD